MKKPFCLFAAGAAAGTIAALLFAKENGENLRKKLAKSKNPAKDLFLEIVEIKLDTLHFLEKKAREILKK